jgi:hypothetical protein
VLPPAPLSTLRCVYWFSCERALFQLPCCCKLARTAAARQTVTEAAVCSKGLVLVAHRTTALPPVYNVGRSQGGTWRSQVHLHRMPRRLPSPSAPLSTSSARAVDPNAPHSGPATRRTQAGVPRCTSQAAVPASCHTPALLTPSLARSSALLGAEAGTSLPASTTLHPRAFHHSRRLASPGLGGRAGGCQTTTSSTATLLLPPAPSTGNLEACAVKAADARQPVAC